MTMSVTMTKSMTVIMTMTMNMTIIMASKDPPKIIFKAIRKNSLLLLFQVI